MTYRCVIFDLFDTLADFKRDLLPTVDINGEAIRSTTAVIYPLFAERYSHITLATFYKAFRESFEEAARLRETEEREVSAHERFRLFFNKLQVPINSETEPFLSSLLDAHMACLADAVHTPEEHRGLLEWLRPRYRLGLISNFDHGPTARRILDRAQMIPFFDLIIISEDHGSRKPYPAIFEAACRALRITAEEAIFVGDSPTIDVAGAKRIGMGAIWLNRTGERLDESIPRPDHVVTSLEELKGILG